MPKVQTSLRLEEDTFNQAKEILKSLGMNFTEAVNVFAAMVVQERGLPFDTTLYAYPAISEEEAREKVAKSLREISPTSGKPVGEFFGELLES